MGKRTRKPALVSAAPVGPRAAPIAQGRFQYSKSYLARLAAETPEPPLIPTPAPSTSLTLLPASLANQNDPNPIHFPSTASHSPSLLTHDSVPPTTPSTRSITVPPNAQPNIDATAINSSTPSNRDNEDASIASQDSLADPQPSNPDAPDLPLPESEPRHSVHDENIDPSNFDHFASASPTASDGFLVPESTHPPLAEDVYGLAESEPLPIVTNSNSENEDAIAPPAKRVRVGGQVRRRSSSGPVGQPGDVGEELELRNEEETESAGLGDFSRVFSYINKEKTRLLASPRSRSRLSSVEPTELSISHPDPTALEPSQAISTVDVSLPLASSSHSNGIGNVLADGGHSMRKPEKANYSRPALTHDPSTTPLSAASSQTSTGKATYVRTAAFAAARIETLNRKAIYERPFGTAPPLPKNKIQPAFPLSSTDKARNLAKKLEATFPGLVVSSNLYPTALQQPFHPGTGPSEDVTHGFWPAPPPLDTGKGLYPAPLVMPDAIVPKDDKRPRVEVFVDNSNVVYSFLNWLRQRPEAKMNVGEKLMKTVSVGGKKGQLDYTTLLAILERGRKVERRVLVASSPLWQGLDVAAQWGYEVSILQRVPRPTNPPPRPALLDSTQSNSRASAGENKTEAKNQSRLSKHTAPPRPLAYQYKEQGVDELIHMKILESLLDFTPSATDPARPLLVVATGDAASSEYAPNGFLGCVRRALERGWDVEIVAFPFGTSSSWIAEERRAEAMADEMGDGIGQRGRLKVIDLEDFAEELVF